MLKTICTSEALEVSRDQFWQAIWTWTLKPHVINKRLFGPKTIKSYRCLSLLSIDEVVNKLESICDAKHDDNFERLLDRLSLDMNIETCPESEARIFSKQSYFIVRKLLLKNGSQSHPFEILFINYSSDEILHYEVTQQCEKAHSAVFSTILQFNSDRIVVKVLEDLRPSSIEWIKLSLLPKLVKWASESNSVDIYEESKSNSLKLIASDNYSELYLHWKEKYGKELVKKWTENTDPLKFVYEDIAIAAYLCLLWANNKVNFVDMGCGNGLLVYILTQEGHRGRGIDLRSRKIWSSYPSSTILQVGAVTPENNCLHPDADWLIGNHSDELTPWIPIFAARSSLRCKFFLLPCCAYELSGQKFQRRNSSCSTYTDYIEYVRRICEKIGFNVLIDRLRIPSTKRICLIGDQKSIDDVAQIEENIKTVLLENPSKDFIPRKAVERVRNCTKVDRSITTRICDIISKELIQRQLATTQATDDLWCSSYALNFQAAVDLLDPVDLKELKNECGGLQTLLKNNHSVFVVQAGRIFFRKPTEKKNKSEILKRKPCWFFNNHPLKCPLDENKCSFLH